MNLAPDWSLLAIVAIFILNYFVVRKFFFQPVNEVLEARAHETKTAEQLYEESLSRFNDATSRMEEQIHVAKREAGNRRAYLVGVLHAAPFVGATGLTTRPSNIYSYKVRRRWPSRASHR